LRAATSPTRSTRAAWRGRRVDEHLRASQARWTILQSSFFLSNLSALAQDGTVYAPAGDASIAMIDPADVAAAAAAVLVDGGYERETLVLTGPKAITFAQAAESLGLAFVDVPLEAAPPPFGVLFEQLRARVASDVTRTVRRADRPNGGEMTTFVVTREAGPAWSDGGIFAQAGATSHAAFMNELADARFLLFAGPLAGSEQGRLRALLVVEAESEAEIAARLAHDPWVASGHLRLMTVEPWNVLVGAEQLEALIARA
jgi:uncharacterized protein YciI